MAQDINTLLDQCDKSSQVLSQEADRASGEVSQIVQFANNLSSILTTTSLEAQASFQALSSRIEAVEQTLESELQSVKESLSNVQGKAGQLQNLTEEKLGLVRSKLGELKSHKTEILSEVKQEVETTKENYGTLTQQAQGFEAEVSKHSETARSQINVFGGAIDEATSSFTELKGSVLKSFTNLEEEFRSKLEALTGDFTTVQEESSSKLDIVQSTLDTTSSDVLISMGQKFAEEVLSEVSSSANTLTGATSSLSEAGTGVGNLLDGKIGSIMDQLDEVVDIIEQIKPVLDMVQEILG